MHQSLENLKNICRSPEQLNIDILHSPVVTKNHHRAFVVSRLPLRRIKTIEDIVMRKKARRKTILIV